MAAPLLGTRGPRRAGLGGHGAACGVACRVSRHTRDTGVRQRLAAQAGRHARRGRGPLAVLRNARPIRLIKGLAEIVPTFHLGIDAVALERRPRPSPLHRM